MGGESEKKAASKDDEADVGEQIKELGDKMDEMESALARVVSPYSEIADYLRKFQQVVGNYMRLMDLYQRHGAISPEPAIPGLRDPISRDIVRILFDKGDRNISQITDALKARRGTASRRIVREKLTELEESGVVVVSKDTRWPTYAISDEVARKWAEILGLTPATGEDEPPSGQ
jgi:DNA-binding transcriptional ArsR family regulator